MVRILRRVVIVSLGLGVWMASAEASSSFLELVDTLEQNELLTPSQAQDLRQKDRPDVWLLGKVHVQSALLQGHSDDKGQELFHTFELRRVRLGVGFHLQGHVEGVVEANFLRTSGPMLQKAALRWKRHSYLQVGAGLDKPLSSLEENTSSSSLKTIERSHINNLTAAPGPLTGAFAEGELGAVFYGLGVYTDQANRNERGERPLDLYNLQLGTYLGPVRIQATHLQSSDPSGVFGSEFENTTTLGAELRLQDFHLQGEFFAAHSDPTEVRGWYVLPSLELNEAHEVVARIESSQARKGTFPAPSRYAADMPLFSRPNTGTGHRALYLGWNWQLESPHHKVLMAWEGAELLGTLEGDLRVHTLHLAWRASL